MTSMVSNVCGFRVQLVHVVAVALMPRCECCVLLGDLYFEKAVNGFMSDLFAKWKVCD